MVIAAVTNLPVEPPYVTSLEELFWAGILVAITMTMHGAGMLMVLRITAAIKLRFELRPSFIAGLTALVVASWLILLVHLLEVFVWALFILWQGALTVPATASTCYYFALMDYTTVGSVYNLIQRWRLLEGMLAMVGLLTFAWSTGVLLTLAQGFQDQQLQQIKQRRDKRHAQSQSQNT